MIGAPGGVAVGQGSMMMHWRVGAWVGVAVAAVAALAFAVEREAPYRRQALGGAGPGHALVLYHPSRESHFSDELSMAFAQGLQASGLMVERATLTADTPAPGGDWTLVAVVSNTYFSTPDLPTLHYLARVRLDGVPTVGLIGGWGATARSQRLLDEALRASGARVLGVHAYWLWRPNAAASTASERDVAVELARRFGLELGGASRAPGPAQDRPPLPRAASAGIPASPR